MSKMLYFILSIVLLGGCAGSPARIGMMAVDELPSEDSRNLCRAYHHHGSEKAKAELIRRNEIPADEWSDIEEKKIRIGMSELGLVCSWGKPGIYGSINRTVNKYGERTQWVYRSCSRCKAKYVYTENGKITSWQN